MKLTILLLIGLLGFVASLDEADTLKKLLQKAIKKRHEHLLAKSVGFARQLEGETKVSDEMQGEPADDGPVEADDEEKTPTESTEEEDEDEDEDETEGEEGGDDEEEEDGGEEGGDNEDEEDEGDEMKGDKDEEDEDEEEDEEDEEKDEDENVPEKKPETKPATLPCPPSKDLPTSMLAFVLASRATKVEIVQASDLTTGTESFAAVLKVIVKSLRRTASDAEESISIKEAADILIKDLEVLAKSFLPAMRDASGLFVRTILYGVHNAKQCDLDSPNVYGCIENKLEDLAKLFRNPKSLDHEVNKMDACDNYKQNTLEGKKAIVADIECLAKAVSKMQKLVSDLVDTKDEQKLASLLDNKPLPNFPGKLSGVGAKVFEDLALEMKGIMAIALRIIDETSNLEENLKNEE